MAGLTVAVMLVPQAMGYAALAGMPPVTGLYAAAAPLIVYAAFGSSSHLQFGPVALVSLLTASALQPLAEGETARYIALAGAHALIVGAMHLLLGLDRAGTVVNLLSHPVISGYVSAAAIIIGLSQVGDLLGFDKPRTKPFSRRSPALIASHVGEANAPTAVIGIASVAFMLLAKRFAPALPAPLLVVLVAALAAWLLHLPRLGVQILEDIPAGLPVPSLPAVESDALGTLLVLALPIVFIGSSATVRASASPRPSPPAAASASIPTKSSSHPGSPTPPQVSSAASPCRAASRERRSTSTLAPGPSCRASSPQPQSSSSCWRSPVRSTTWPRAVLAAIVVVAVIGLVDIEAARRTWQVSRTAERYCL